MEKLKLAIVGCGFLGHIIAEAWEKGLLPEYELVGCLSRNHDATTMLANKYACKACNSLGELLALTPDYVVEAASPDAVREIAEAVLSAGSNLVLLSIGALADINFLERVKSCARTHNRRIHLASGAIGGFDVLRTAALMSGIQASITTEKGPNSLRNTAVFSEDLLCATKKSEVFGGNARDAIALFPTKVNVAVATALASAGIDATRVSINSVPGFKGDDHRIEIQGDEVRAVIDIYSETSAIAGWSVVALLRNVVAPITFG